LLLAYIDDILQNPERASEEDVHYAERLRTIYQDWEQRVHRQGMEEGLREALVEALVDAYQARFGAMPGKLRTAIEATTDRDTLRRWLPLFVTASPDDIVAAVLPSPRP
jgi:hypothetical protein